MRTLRQIAGWGLWTLALGWVAMCAATSIALIINDDWGAASVGAVWAAPGVVVLLYPLATRISRRRVRQREARAFAARAEQQHRAYLAGDPRGVYGMYRPTDIEES